MTPANGRMQTSVVVGARTDVGCVRDQNEDSMLVKTPLLVVADGIGGQEAGEVASKIAVDTMAQEAPLTADSNALGDAVVEANRQIMDAAAYGRGRQGMGTTMTAAVIDGSRMAVAQVGDSRCYRFRDGKLEQLTHDHSLIASLVETGQITEEEARTHPSRSIITKALGSDPYLVPDLFEFDVQKGDKILLCSDGLHGMVPKDEITEVMAANMHPQRTANRLVELARNHGGQDNITVIVASIANTNRVSTEATTTVKKKHRWSVLVFALVAIALVGCAVGAFDLYVKNSAYLISEEGYVNLYSGRLESLGAFEYRELVENTGVETDMLPDITADKLEEGIQFDSLEDAEAAVEDYETQVEEAEAEAASRASDSSSDNDSDSDSSDTSSEGSNGSDSGGSSSADSSSSDGSAEGE